MPGDQLNDFINAQHERDLCITKTLATIEQQQKDMSERLFGGPNQKGLLPYLIEQHAETAKDIRASVEKVNVRATALETWRTASTRWIAGAVAVLALQGTALGMWLTHTAKVTK
jgi:hypothetical protein